MGVSPSPDAVIAGAGIVGLSLALELHSRGAHVLVLERGTAMSEASAAAAGMLAVNDPDNPPELLPLSQLSASLYAAYLDRIAALSGQHVPFQTHTTLQQDGPAPTLSPAELASYLGASPSAETISLSHLAEHSLDPRQLATALLSAARAARISLREHTSILATRYIGQAVELDSTGTATLTTPHFVDCTGAWTQLATADTLSPVFPVKGQMLAVATPSTTPPLTVTVRTHELYLVPRTTGPNAGRIVIGATVEDAGFSKVTDARSLQHLHRRAAELFPPLAHAPVLEQWAGLRPATRDRLPVLGPHPADPRHLFATAHFRNGILLAPATAQVVADLITGRAPAVSLDPFSPARLLAAPTLSGRR